MFLSLLSCLVYTWYSTQLKFRNGQGFALLGVMDASRNSSSLVLLLHFFSKICVWIREESRLFSVFFDTLSSGLRRLSVDLLEGGFDTFSHILNSDRSLLSTQRRIHV